MSDKPAPGTISTAYDIEADPDADEFSAIDWYLDTGEDLGLPPGWLESYQKAYAEALEKAEATGP